MDPSPQRVEIVIPVRTIMVVLGFALAVALAVLSVGTLLSIFLAAVLALGLGAIVAALVRRGWKRGRAALVVFAALFASVFVLVLVTAGPLWDQIKEFLRSLPAFWDDLQQQDWFKTLTSTAGADDKIRDALKDLAAGLPDAANAILGIAGGVFGSILSLVTLTFLSLFLLMERPTITDWLFGFASPPAERRWRPVVEDSISAISSSLVGNVAISVVAAVVAGLSAWALGLPFPIVLAVITGLLDLIPQIGATVAAVILCAVALTESTFACVMMAVIQLIYQQVENYIIYPIVYRRAVELSPFTTIAAVIKTVLREAGEPRRERMAALRAAENGEQPISPEARARSAEPAAPLPGSPGSSQSAS